MISSQLYRRAVWRPLLQLPRHLDLILSLTRRELASRYRGSALGLFWAVAAPAVTIAIYTFIFAEIFGARFGATGSPWEFAIYLFCGLLPWMAFSEAVQNSSQTIVSHSNLVKRVVFPLEVLPVSHTLTSICGQLLGTIALIGAALIVRREIHITALWLPVLLAPQLVATLGVAWLVASLGVFIRDVAQGISLVLMAWLFLTPIIYPESMVPETYLAFIRANPFTSLVGSYRRIFLEGLAPDWRGLAYFSIFALVCFLFGYWWFAKTRKNFADVI